jgi:hypothetical protein
MHWRYAPSGTPDEWSRDDKLLSLVLHRFNKLPDKQQAFPVVLFAGHELHELPRNFRPLVADIAAIRVNW